MTFIVAIDGPAASGKGTIARAVAAKFGFQHLDTGLLYRAVGVLVQEGADPIVAARELQPENLQRSDLRTVGAGKAASKVATIPEVRSALLDFQIRFSKAETGAVLDGRDIGTVVCPDADVKLFVTATDLVRAKRRWLETGGPNADLSLDQVLAEVRSRDKRDRDRKEAPLAAADDAIVVDTSELDIQDAVALCSEIISKALVGQQTGN